jgi:hypothetical protein
MYKLLGYAATVMMFLLTPLDSSYAAPETFTVKFVGCFPHGTCYIGISPSSGSTTCPNTAQIRFDITEPGSNAQYSAALVAFTTGKKIHGYITSNCVDGYPSPTYLHITN